MASIEEIKKRLGLHDTPRFEPLGDGKHLASTRSLTISLADVTDLLGDADKDDTSRLLPNVNRTYYRHDHVIHVFGPIKLREGQEWIVGGQASIRPKE